MKLTLDVQRVTEAAGVPNDDELATWSDAALSDDLDEVELTIRLVDIDEMTNLNTTYRDKAGPTNVLSFPFEQPADVELAIPLLGDIVICAPVVEKEAKDQGKALDAHWAHLVVHGCLHLLGMDHLNATDADKMESKEIIILKSLGFENPYHQHSEGS